MKNVGKDKAFTPGDEEAVSIPFFSIPKEPLQGRPVGRRP